MGFDPQKHCKIIEKNAKKDLIFLHGFTDNKRTMQLIGEQYQNLPDYNLIFCDARGHGTRKNDGKKTDWFGSNNDFNQLINTRNHDTVLIGVSMGGTMALTIGMENPHVKQVFAIDAANGKKLFETRRQYYENRYGVVFQEFMKHDIDDALPYHYEKCQKHNNDKFFLIHAETDHIVPFSEMQYNQKELCIPNENCLTYPKSEIPDIPIDEIAHVVPLFHPKTHQFIKKNLKK